MARREGEARMGHDVISYLLRLPSIAASRSYSPLSPAVLAA